MLCKIAMAEAEGEDVEGKALVMLVVLNRTKAEGFPDTVSDVIYEKGQFTPVANGRFQRRSRQRCFEALQMIVQKSGTAAWEQPISRVKAVAHGTEII